MAKLIIQEFKEETEDLFLLHSDFHTGNVALINGEILFFDSGDCPLLFGHKYHDLSRLVMYFPDGIIFKNKPINIDFCLLYSKLQNDLDNVAFLKFCFLQSLLVYNNHFIPQVQEITKYLFEKLKNY
jgi:hypothetical protein